MSEGNGSVAVCECKLGKPICVAARMLASRGFEVRRLDDEDSRILKITSMPDMKFEITVTDDGYVQWEYWPRTGHRVDPVTIAGLAAEVLAADLGGSLRDSIADPVLADTLLDVIGRMMEASGLRVWHVPWDDGAHEIVVVNTVALECGEVHVADDGSLMCEYPGQVGDARVRDIIETVIGMLTVSQRA